MLYKLLSCRLCWRTAKTCDPILRFILWSPKCHGVFVLLGASICLYFGYFSVLLAFALKMLVSLVMKAKTAETSVWVLAAICIWNPRQCYFCFPGSILDGCSLTALNLIISKILFSCTKTTTLYTWTCYVMTMIGNYNLLNANGKYYGILYSLYKYYTTFSIAFLCNDTIRNLVSLQSCGRLK